MSEKTYKAIISKKLSKGYEKRWVIVDAETNEVLDDAQGYGYKTPQKAYAAYGYKSARKTADGRWKKTKKDIQTEEIVDWMEEHGALKLLNDYAFCVWKDNMGDKKGFETDMLDLLKENYSDAPYSSAQLYRAWQKADDLTRRRKRRRHNKN